MNGNIHNWRMIQRQEFEDSLFILRDMTIK